MHSKVHSSALSVSQVQRLEKYVIKTLGIPSAVLMDRAGEAVALSVQRSLGRTKNVKAAIVCGAGNNGGDGFVTARYLWAYGFDVKVLVVGPLKDLKGAPRVFYGVLKALKVPVVFLKTLDRSTARIIKSSDAIVDALFGIGLNRPLAGLHEKLVIAMNQSLRKIWSVDIPSGLDGSTGKMMGPCVYASTTVTFTCLKKGFVANDGPKVTGCVEIADIGIPQSIVRKFGG